MSRYQLKKRLARVGDNVDDFLEEANDTYSTLRRDMRRKAKDLKGRAYDVRDRAEEAWDHRDDYLDDLADGVMSLGGCAAAMVTRKFKNDPIGTIAIGAIALWVVGRLARR
jgi:ElaB/YqjD/DUF883 family membrane-anchored ribosome-binding protein